MYILLFGPPGSGKSTQGALLAQRLGIPHLSVGELLRSEVEAGSPRAQRIASPMSAGGMVDDSVVSEILREHLAKPDAAGGFILDGFPRTAVQIPLLEDLVSYLKLDSYRVIDITLSPEESFQRLLVRGRGDDQPVVIQRRLDAYLAMAGPVLAYFQGRGELLVVDGHGTLDEVAGRVDIALGRR